MISFTYVKENSDTSDNEQAAESSTAVFHLLGDEFQFMCQHLHFHHKRIFNLSAIQLCPDFKETDVLGPSLKQKTSLCVCVCARAIVFNECIFKRYIPLFLNKEANIKHFKEAFIN